MSSRRHTSVILAGWLLCTQIGGTALAVEYLFQGRVYEGVPWEQDTPIAGVTVELWGANDSGVPIQQINSTATDASGWYGLLLDTGDWAYDFYILWEKNKSGYVSTDARTVGGTRLNADQIQFEFDLAGVNLTGNKFWDKPEGQPPSNQPPVAVDDSASTTQDTAVDIDVLDNDSDPDGDPLHINTATDPPHGTTVNHGTHVTYTPDAGYTGTDTFDYTAGDGKGGTDTATVTVTVQVPSQQAGTLNGYKRDADTGAGLAGWKIYVDQNQNGQWDAGEPYDLTDAAGYYEIPNLEEGTYPVCEVMQDGWGPAGGATVCVGGVTIVTGVITTQDFHNRRSGSPEPGTGSIRGTKFNDLNGNAQRDPGEPGLAGWQITLQDDDGNVLATATTDANGDYEFTSLAGGAYRVDEVQQSAWRQTSPEVDGQPAWWAVGLEPGGTIDEVDFGNIRDDWPGTEYEEEHGDAPQPYADFYLAVSETVFLGRLVDGEAAMQRDPHALGDDNNDGSDDEDGVEFASSLIPGHQATVRIDLTHVTGPDWTVRGWIDYDRNGSFDMAERIADSSVTLTAGIVNTVTFTVPATAVPGVTFARFYIIDTGPEPPWGWPCGEIEDYEVVIGGDGPGPLEGQWDFGDAPEGVIDGNSYNYQTTLLHNGARHRIVASGPCLRVNNLWPRPDAEPDGQPNIHASGDDISGDMDEYTAWYLDAPVQGRVCTARVNVDGGGGYVDAWIDFNRDGMWQHPGERIFSVHLPNGQHPVDYTTPDDALPGDTFARIRINSSGPLPPYGPADDGEVVDDTTSIYKVDYGDAPDPPYPTLDSSGGPWNPFGVQLEGLRDYVLGAKIDSELDGQPDADALGDDNDGQDDDDGVHFLTKLIPGQRAKVKAVVTIGPYPNAEEFCGWIDFDQSGDWEPSELAIRYGPLKATGKAEEIVCEFTVPQNARLGTTYARFTITYLTHGAPTRPDPPRGRAAGEIEDYKIVIGEDGPYPSGTQDKYDFGDAPVSYGNAWHTLRDHLTMGPTIDAENSANFSPGAGGDDAHNTDDEDGMTLATSLKWGAPATVCVEIHNNHSDAEAVTLAGWVDFDGNGQWEPIAEHIGSRVVHSPPFSIVKECWTFTVPQNAKPGNTFARFRLYRDDPNPLATPFAVLPTGAGGEGEVEDYRVYILSDAPGPDGLLDYGDAPGSYPVASHVLGGPHAGAVAPDGESSSQPDPPGPGDDGSGVDDEDGLALLSDLVVGQLAGMGTAITALGKDVTAALWIDFNRDGDWNDPGESLGPVGVAGGFFASQGWIFTVPAGASPGTTHARLRVYEGLLSSVSPGGAAGPGEVEDVVVEIKSGGQMLPPGEIFGGVKFNDLNGNGLQEAGESGLANWTIWIDLNGNGVKDAGEETLTNPDGSFYFTALSPGTYTVHEEMQSGWTQTYPGGSGVHTVTIQAGQPVPSVAFGNRHTGTPALDGIVHGYKWNDLNNSGIRDVSEPWLAGWTFWLDINNNGQQDAGDMYEQTDATGHFRFAGVPVGTYTLGEQLQGGWTQTTPGGAGTYTVTVQAGQGTFPMMFGNRQSGGATADGKICGSKWNDLNGDGVPDAAEPWLANWKVYLDLNLNHRWDAGEPLQLTDATGSFEFTSLAVGTYTVAEEMQTGWTQTWPGGAGTHVIQIQPGIQPACVMFGNRQGGGPGPGPGPDQTLDWGDAPDPSYPTLRAANGAYHTIVPGFSLGGAVDGEPDGRPTPDARGDDHFDGDDEDGVFFLTPLLPGQPAEVEVLASADGVVDAWIDFDADGSWAQAADRIFAGEAVQAGGHVLSFGVPFAAATDIDTYARFRFSSTGVAQPDGPAQDGEVEDYHILLGAEGPGVPGEGPPPHVKWSQPPVEIDPNVEAPPVFCGWNEPARSTQDAGARRQWRMDADDFRCLGSIPVTRIRWWGGYKAWKSPEPPEQQPHAWHIGFWANQVEGLAPDELHLERLVWALEIPNERVHREPVGFREFPEWLDETCFVYELHLEPEEWFHQAEFPTNEGIFWLSITAIYPPDVEQVNLWGWHTRPHVWRDGARNPAIMGEWPTPEQRLFPNRICPIESDTLCGEVQPYDLCFELLTEDPWVKWDQPLVPMREWPYAADRESMALEGEDENVVVLVQAADDWICERADPVVAVSWHGSYLGYGYEACKCEPMPEPRRPDYFLLSISTNEPADESDPLSHARPGEMVWQYAAYDYDEVLVGYDANPQAEPNEPVFRYSVRLPEDAWFYQPGEGQVFWFSVAAVYRGVPDEVPYAWGWADRPHEVESIAVYMDYRVAAGPRPRWWILRDPVDRGVDLSFTLYTVPQLRPVAHWRFDETEGQIAFDSAGDHHATVHGATWSEGKIEGALEFNGFNDYVDCGQSDRLSPEHMTLMMWLRPEHMGGMRSVLSRALAETNVDYGVKRRLEGQIEFFVVPQQGDPISVVSEQTTGLGEWSHVAVTCDGEQLSVYLNGVCDGSVACPPRPPRPGHQLVIGSLLGQTRFYHGKIDDVQLYDVTLSPEHVEESSAR